MKFRYKKYGKDILRPVIPIEIANIGEDGFISYEVLVDSGADVCIFDSQISDVLGIKLKDGDKQEVSGITGKQEYYYLHEVILKVGGWPYKTKVGFMENISHLGHGVVGQKGFFDIFVVKFDLLKEKVELKERRARNYQG